MGKEALEWSGKAKVSFPLPKTAGTDGFLIQVHPNPNEALKDGA